MGPILREIEALEALEEIGCVLMRRPIFLSEFSIGATPSANVGVPLKKRGRGP
jgi:hypothetical protein